MKKATLIKLYAFAVFTLARADAALDSLNISGASAISFGQYRYSERGLSICYSAGFDSRELLRILSTASASDEPPSLLTRDASTGFITIYGQRYIIHFPPFEENKPYSFTISGAGAFPVSYALPPDQAKLLRYILPSNSQIAPLQ